MDWLNYHHLYYFWTVAKLGSISAASKRLLLAQPTISAQIHALEDSLGEKLFTRSGRNLALTEIGRIVYGYAEEIFSLGQEMREALKGVPKGRMLKLIVGIADAVPKLVAHRLISRGLTIPQPVQLACVEDKPDRLLGELAAHRLDVVIADLPANPSIRVRVFNHLLGSCAVSILGVAKLAKNLSQNFPHSLDAQPFLLPLENSMLRRSLEQWFQQQDIRPHIVAEFQDSALMKVFAQQGMGLIAVPSIIETEVQRQYDLVLAGRIPQVVERFYAITVERRLKHPAVVALAEAARTETFI